MTSLSAWISSRHWELTFAIHQKQLCGTNYRYLLNHTITFHANLFQTALQEQMVGLFDEHKAEEGYKSKNIKGSLYDQHDPHHVAKQQMHLSTSQWQELAQLLVRFPKLFSSKLGCFPNKKVHLELQMGTTPFCCCLYPVPKHHEHEQERTSTSMWHRNARVMWSIRMAIAFVHHSEEGWPSLMDI
jgi:hypothetical protein